MNWKECVQQNELFKIRYRADWPVGEGKTGFDCNIAFTFDDAWGAISWVWTWPGDYLLNLPQVRLFFDMGGETTVGSSWSTALGWLIFLCIGALNQDR